MDGTHSSKSFLFPLGHYSRKQNGKWFLKRLKRINENPEKASSQEIDDLLDDLKKQQALSEQAKDEIDKQGKRIAKKIDELKDLVDKAHNKKGIENEVEGLLSDANDGLRSMKEALDTVPSLLGKMLYTLDEMKKGSEPDDSADYWEERDQINKQTEQLQELSKCEELGRNIDVLI